MNEQWWLWVALACLALLPYVLAFVAAWRLVVGGGRAVRSMEPDDEPYVPQ